MVANPRATIETGTEQLKVTAEPAGPPERARLWGMVTEKNPAFKEYEKKTRRTIPLMILTPSLPSAGRAENVRPRRRQ